MKAKTREREKESEKGKIRSEDGQTMTEEIIHGLTEI